MVINIRLIERTPVVDFDSLGRDWYGFDPDVTAHELWAHNRARWDLKGERIDEERWVAFNFQGRVVLVAELTTPGHETVLDKRPGTFKKALIGTPLEPGHPVYAALIGTEVKYVRNPATYGPDPDIDIPVTVERDPEDSPVAVGQGRQLDVHIRKLIEDAAQHRLMQHYRDAGWGVTDTHLTESYDAVAIMGDAVLYLEAKGTQSRGESVIVTPNEVDHARKHPGTCVMGVWSGIRIVGDDVDPHSGEFRLLNFDPDAGELRPRDYDWWLPS